jgi:hypothetical protein
MAKLLLHSMAYSLQRISGYRTSYFKVCIYLLYKCRPVVMCVQHSAELKIFQNSDVPNNLLMARDTPQKETDVRHSWVVKPTHPV